MPTNLSKKNSKNSPWLLPEFQFILTETILFVKPPGSLSALISREVELIAHVIHNHLTKMVDQNQNQTKFANPSRSPKSLSIKLLFIENVQKSVLKLDPEMRTSTMTYIPKLCAALIKSRSSCRVPNLLSNNVKSSMAYLSTPKIFKKCQQESDIHP